MGLLNMTPKDEALLTLGLGLLNSKGSFGNALGQAGMQSMQALQAAKEREQLAKTRQMQEEMLRMQMEGLKRQANLDAMVPGFTKPETMDNRDVGQPGEAPVQPDLAGLARQYMTAPGGLQRGLMLQEALKKQTKPPIISKPGDVARDESGAVLWSNPDKPKEADASPLAKLIAEMNALPPDHPLREIYKEAIKKAATHQAPVSVSYGAPVAGQDAAGNPVFFQPGRDGRPPSIVPGVTPPKKETPATLQEKLAQNAVTLQKIDKAIGLVDQSPGSLGIQNYLGDPIMQRVDPSGIEVRAMVADIGGQKIHDRSGAAVTVGEAERLKPYIPAATDSPETVKKKLRLFRNEYASMQQAIQSGAGIADASKKSAEGVRRYNPATGKIE